MINAWIVCPSGSTPYQPQSSRAVNRAWRRNPVEPPFIDVVSSLVLAADRDVAIHR